LYAIKPKPLVRAAQLTEDADWEAIAAWCGGRIRTFPTGGRELTLPNDNDDSGGWPAGQGDWIIRGITGRFFWRDAEAFGAYYAPHTQSPEETPMTPRREPALILGLIAAIVQMVSAFVLPLTADQQGVINAVAIAITGLVTAVLVHSDQLAPAILGVIQAALALGLAFGLHMTAGNQAVIMAFAAAIVAAFVRTQVTAHPAAVRGV
jgi:hypothetical protein